LKNIGHAVDVSLLLENPKKLWINEDFQKKIAAIPIYSYIPVIESDNSE
jgi:hypothetical protein